MLQPGKDRVAIVVLPNANKTPESPAWLADETAQPLWQKSLLYPDDEKNPDQPEDLRTTLGQDLLDLCLGRNH
eukprot:2695179-Lingulodinium_polyedra.AAC.1